VLVETRRGGDFELGAKPRYGVEVGTGLAYLVIVLIAAIDAAFGIRIRVQIVDTVQKALTLAEIQPVLDLPDELFRLVDDRIQSAKEKSFARVTGVQKDCAKS